MEPLLIILVPGVLGGIVVAYVFFRLARVPSPWVTMSERLDPPSTGMINMARIRVAGGGGLGMVAMSIVVAIFVPRIRFTMALAFVLGCVMAAVLVALRRRNGNSPSGIDPGAHALLPLEVRNGTGHEASDGAADVRDVTSGVLPGVAGPAPGLAI
jgi:hypothetical protein